MQRTEEIYPITFIIFLLLFICLTVSCSPIPYVPPSEVNMEEVRAALEEAFPQMLGEGSAIEAPLSVGEIEIRSMESIQDCDRCPTVPFGFMNDQWRDFKSRLRKGDVIAFFRSDDESWEGLYGREGYAIIRDGKVVHIIITILS